MVDAFMTPEQCRCTQAECRRQLLEALRDQTNAQAEDIRELKGDLHELSRKFDDLNKIVIEFATITKLHNESSSAESGIRVRTRKQDTAKGWWMENWKIIIAFFFPLQILLLLMAAALGQHFHSIIDQFADKVVLK